MAAEAETASAGRDLRPDIASRDLVRIWDPFVRIFHWSLAGLFLLAWASGEEWKNAHNIAGYSILGLVGLRVIWGFVGPAHARFANFVRSPATVASFLAETAMLRAKRHYGHNPAGGAMIIALLATLVAICVTGWMMTTFTFWGVEWVEEAHEASVNLALALIGLHLLGVAVASFEHRENLVRAMITGWKRR